jgi:hypothetical protein
MPVKRAAAMRGSIRIQGNSRTGTIRVGGGEFLFNREGESRETGIPPIVRAYS